MSRVALISGITGQDGSYLAEYLLSEDYIVHGIVRKASHFNTERLEHLYSAVEGGGSRLFFHYGDVLDTSRIFQILSEVRPSEIYNLAAQSHVKVSFDLPQYTINVVSGGVQSFLDAIKVLGLDAKLYQASSSEMFGKAVAPQSESSPFIPQSPYAAAKLLAHQTVRIYREAYGIYAVSGILFNHESPRRNESFVTRKITKAVAEIVNGKRTKLKLGNLEAKRDWGYAPEYVRAMHKMLQVDNPTDFVIATGKTYSVREFLEFSFEYVGLNWKDFVEYDENLERPLEVDVLQGDATLATKVLGWESSVYGRELAEIMVKADLSRFE